MRLVLLALVHLPLLSVCQTTDKVANDAFVLIRMVNKYHVEPREVNAAFSADVFTGMLAQTDEERLLFNQNDIDRLTSYRNTLQNEIKQRKTGYLDLFINIYRHRLEQADSLVNQVGKTPFDFYNTEKFTVAEDTSYPASAAAMRLKLYKKIKEDALDEFTDNLPVNFKSFAPAKQKKYTDSALAAAQRKVISSYKRRIDDILQNPHGIIQYTGNIYCQTIASCFDPHTEFFPPEEKENFESVLGKQPFQFGFRLKPDKNGGIIIDNLQPGSPAYKSGKLNKGDKFMSLQWDGRQPIDISDASMREFTELIDETSHEKVLFTMKKADGSLVQVSLQKELAVGNDDDDRVKSFILKGDNNTVGYVYLPAFYQDWESNGDDLNGCANDVGREILKLKKENIKGLILDIRYNGGGSVQEATELAGIFIGAGPVAQEKEKDEKVRAIKNFNNGTIFDGPLVILVNSYSASASELVAGTLQDYNRAVIVGSTTYGKATMQVVLPMDTTVTPENYARKQTDNYLKLTVSRLYRVNGTTAQVRGVQPDIVLPDMLDAYISKEADEPHALKPTTVAPNKYYRPLPPIALSEVAAGIKAEVDTSKYFNTVKNYLALAAQKKTPRDISLNVKDAIADAGQQDDNALDTGVGRKKFTVQNSQLEMARLRADSNLRELNDEFSQQVASDAYINIAYEVLSKLKPQ